DVPDIIGEIVHKLLAKHPNQRYQSAFGLQADLKRAKALIRKGERASRIYFSLGRKDQFQAVAAGIPLVGRDVEISNFEATFESMKIGPKRGRLIVLRGASGMGKSRLISAFRNNLTEKRVRFISVTFSQQENALP